MIKEQGILLVVKQPLLFGFSKLWFKGKGVMKSGKKHYCARFSFSKCQVKLKTHKLHRNFEPLRFSLFIKKKEGNRKIDIGYICTHFNFSSNIKCDRIHLTDTFISEITGHVEPRFRAWVQHCAVFSMNPTWLVIIGLFLVFIPVPTESSGESRRNTTKTS